MGILDWNKPKKAISSKEWKESFVFDGGPAGGYVSNMSNDDRRKWKAKLVGHRVGHPQVEIRRNSTVIIVSVKGGYKYKYYKRDETARYNMHMATAGAIQMSFQDYEDMKEAVEEAKMFLTLGDFSKGAVDGKKTGKKKPKEKKNFRKLNIR